MTHRSFDVALARSDVLGATCDGDGTNFALFSENAQKVELCLYDADGQTETARLALPEMEGGIWFGYLPDIKAGQAYGYRVHGPYAPKDGHRFNPAKLLIDPYARQLTGGLEWDDALFGYEVASGDDLTRDDRDSAAFVPKAIVTHPDFSWDSDRALRTRWSDTVLYEAHVKGLTQKHPAIAAEDRGYFAGLGSDPMIDHLTRLGITAIELLPVQSFMQDRHLLEKGLSNYWGYNTLNFFAPHQPYLKGGRIDDLKMAIRRLHAAGIEVILDVVYNHTAEGNELGPTLSFRGIDNASYYLHGEDPRHCYDTTGTGNTLNVAHPMVLRMVLDSLRYWVTEFHVDGFRFDLASTLGREAAGFEREGAFFGAIRQDPVLSGVKLIAEPWDIGDGGYQVGGFPWPFREWNDKFRDDVRAYWRKSEGSKGALADRLVGSPVQFDHAHRPATSSVNFLSAHDGFTLWDTVSFNDKHNEANGEDGRDGHDNNLSDNMGIEGATEDEGVTASRLRRAKAMLATLLFARGVPMILAGDEFGNSQNGNNNAYCQDNDIGWLDWENANDDLTQAVASMTALRREHRALRARNFAGSTGVVAQDWTEVAWLRSDGEPMAEADWDDEGAAFCLHLSSQAQEVVIVIAGRDDATITLAQGPWTFRFGTDASVTFDEDATVTMGWQTVALLTKAPASC